MLPSQVIFYMSDAQMRTETRDRRNEPQG